MGRRVNISTPVVLQTELASMTENFSIVADGSLEQWYYANTGVYQPDRSAGSHLTLTPLMQAFDPDTRTTYTPSFSAVAWYALENGTETEITNTTDSTEAQYVKLPTGQLRVKKNVSSDAAVTIRCVATYVDPRLLGVYGTVEAQVLLATNRDATTVFPTIHIETTQTVLYRPLTDTSSQKTLRARVMQGDLDITQDSVVRWYAMTVEGNDTTLTPIDTLPCYVSGQGTAQLTVDALYTSDITIVARAAENATAVDWPAQDTVRLAWSTQKLDGITYCDNGSAVRLTTGRMYFGLNLNMRHQIMPEARVKAHLVYKWRQRMAQSSVETVIGWGPKIGRDGADLLNNTSPRTALVWPEIHLLSEYQRVVFTSGGVTKTVVDDATSGNPVYARNRD